MKDNLTSANKAEGKLRCIIRNITTMHISKRKISLNYRACTVRADPVTLDTNLKMIVPESTV